MFVFLKYHLQGTKLNALFNVCFIPFKNNLFKANFRLLIFILKKTAPT